MDINFKVGNVLKTIRKQKGFSQSELCEGICSLNHLGNIEGNKCSPSFEILRALTGKLGISIELLIKYTEETEESFYVQQKLLLQQTLENYKLDECEFYLSTITEDVYTRLQLSEQQFIDRTRASILLNKYKDFENAYLLAETALNKTYRPSTKFFTREECLLINMLLKINQSPQNIELTQKAFNWVMKQRKHTQDRYALLLLVTGLTMTSFLQENWIMLMDYATLGETIAEEEGKSKFIPNFIFMQGLAVYQLKTDQERGLNEMKRAMEYTLLIGQKANYKTLTTYLQKYNIDMSE